MYKNDLALSIGIAIVVYVSVAGLMYFFFMDGIK